VSLSDSYNVAMNTHLCMFAEFMRTKKLGVYLNEKLYAFKSVCHNLWIMETTQPCLNFIVVISHVLMMDGLFSVHVAGDNFSKTA